MPIRYKCQKCGSTLNIKAELAGTAGKCPKCQTAFTVPQPKRARAEAQPTAEVASGGASKPSRSLKSAARKAPAASGSGDDFDPMAVLMGDEPAGDEPAAAEEAPPASAPLSDDEIPADAEFELEIGGDPDAEPAPRKSKKKRKRVQFDADDDFDASVPNSASARADAMLSGGASAGAKDLLTRTMEESRARASRVDDDHGEGDQGPGIKDYIREYGAKAAGIVVGFVIIIYGLNAVSNSMMGGGMPLPELGRVYGTVTLDGKPLAGATVKFRPRNRKLSVDEAGKYRYRSSTAVTDEDGYYDLYYSEDVRGAAVTEHRVSIEKVVDGVLVTPGEYYQITDHLRTVESGNQEFNFDLNSPAPPPPASE